MKLFIRYSFRLILLILVYLLDFISIGFCQNSVIDCAVKDQHLKIDTTNFSFNRFRFARKFKVADLKKARKIVFRNGIFQLDCFEDDQDTDFSSPQIIPLAFHVLKKTDNSVPVTEEEIQIAVVELNKNFKDVGFDFELCSIDYIINDSLYDLMYYDSLDIHDFNAASDEAPYKLLNVKENNIPNKLNIYLVKNISNNYSNHPKIDFWEQHITMDGYSIKAGRGSKYHTLLTHEIGHWFDLFHTHAGSKSDDPELVSRSGTGSNCSNRGDGICDTPSDPGISTEGLLEDCKYVGTTTDANGDFYSPDTRNYMSYAAGCRLRFTEEQIIKMRSALLTIKQERGYELYPCGITISKSIANDHISAGFEIAEFYSINGSHFLLLMKTRTSADTEKNLHIYRLNVDGTLGDRIYSQRFSEGWTAAKIYEVNGQHYLFLLKKVGYSDLDHNVHIYKFKQDGTIQSLVEVYNWTEGWTNIEIYTAGKETYLFLLKQQGLSSVGKNVHIHKFNLDGRIGDRVFTYKWTEGWTSTKFYKVKQQTYLMLTKVQGESAAGKNVHIQRIDENGGVVERVADYKWTTGWSNVEILSSENSNFLFLQKVNGFSASGHNIHIHILKNNGAVGARVVEYKLDQHWLNARFYSFSSQNFENAFIFFSNPTTGKYQIYRVK